MARKCFSEVAHELRTRPLENLMKRDPGEITPEWTQVILSKLNLKRRVR